MVLHDMMTYRDKTWCGSKDCLHKDCTRRITEEHKDRAVELGLLVSYTDLSRVCSSYYNKAMESIW